MQQEPIGDLSIETTLQYDEQHHVPSGRKVSKVDVFNWKIRDVPGTFEWIEKSRLSIDHECQRIDVSQVRILNFARDWSWVACGCLVVGVRPDGLNVIIDGQHRWLAAKKRSDIQSLPCLLFQVQNRAEEAARFIDVNCNRGPVLTLQKFGPMITACDPAALAVKTMVEADGYTISRQHAGGHVSCVGTLIALIQDDPTSAQNAWDVAVLLYKNRAEPPQGDIIGGLAFVEQFLRRRNMGSIKDKQNLQRLIQFGVDTIKQKIVATKQLLGKGGHRAAAQGIVHVLNHNRQQKNRIPDVYSKE